MMNMSPEHGLKDHSSINYRTRQVSRMVTYPGNERFLATHDKKRYFQGWSFYRSHTKIEEQVIGLESQIDVGKP